MRTFFRRALLAALALLVVDMACAQTADLTTYLGSLRTTLNANKRYPIGREASMTCPEGTASVHFTLGRNGLLRTSGIEKSSGSQLLDQAALATVRRTTFPTPPANAWDGPDHTFTIELAFRDEGCIPVDPKKPAEPAGDPAPTR